MRKLLLSILLGASLAAAGQRQYHVSITGNDLQEGSQQHPFRTINKAAAVALPGDMVIVHAGTYREWVKPVRGGTSEKKRIIYRAAKGERVDIKGSEVVTGWKLFKANVWIVEIDNSFFGDYNPYTDKISGDWYFGGMRLRGFLKGDWYYHPNLHTGEVYLNGRALHEADSLGALIHDSNIGDPIGVSDSSVLDGRYTWFTEQRDGKTIIYANFRGIDPATNTIEINVRPACFYPQKPGINYITVEGFHFSQAATQWAAPTAEQIGAVGTHYSKGWIIQNNTVSESKCAGITLGKDRASGHNEWLKNFNREGHDIYNEVIQKAMSAGWNKANIGSHVVRNNTVFNCGQAGICGSLGAIYSVIDHNDVFNIYTNRRFWGAEMAGIKIHGAIDAVISNNRIHNSYNGLWLDWMAQGTRVTGNVLYENDCIDFFPEVNHGPYTIDHNYFLSPFSVKDWSEGGAYVHNVFGGVISRAPQSRTTPYFQPHTTGRFVIDSVQGGDNRFYENIFCGDSNVAVLRSNTYLPVDAVDPLIGNLSIYDGAHYPVIKKDNITIPKSAVEFAVSGNSVQLKINDAQITLKPFTTIDSRVFGRTTLSQQDFNNADGKPVIFAAPKYAAKPIIIWSK